jgi:hypothetical protein
MLNFDIEGWFHKLYVCVSNCKSRREVVQWLSRARYIIDQHVYVVKVPAKNPILVDDIIKDDPVFTKPVTSVNIDLHNTSQGVLE